LAQKCRHFAEIEKVPAAADRFLPNMASEESSHACRALRWKPWRKLPVFQAAAS
jgi:hypothetical protein